MLIREELSVRGYIIFGLYNTSIWVITLLEVDLMFYIEFSMKNRIEFLRDKNSEGYTEPIKIVAKTGKRFFGRDFAPHNPCLMEGPRRALYFSCPGHTLVPTAALGSQSRVWLRW